MNVNTFALMCAIYFLGRFNLETPIQLSLQLLGHITSIWNKSPMTVKRDFYQLTDPHLFICMVQQGTTAYWISIRIWIRDWERELVTGKREKITCITEKDCMCSYDGILFTKLIDWKDAEIKFKSSPLFFEISSTPSVILAHSMRALDGKRFLKNLTHY